MPLDKGLAITYKWIKEQYGKCKKGHRMGIGCKQQHGSAARANAWFNSYLIVIANDPVPGTFKVNIRLAKTL